jgi:F-type H+-transporting ATPase subunit b
MRLTGKYRVAVGVMGLCFCLSGLVWASEAGGHAAAHGLNWGDFALRILNFAIMAAILFKLLKKPVVNFLASRRENIDKALAELEQKKQEAEAKLSEYKGKLAVLERETEKIVAEYVQEGEIEKQKIISAAEKQALYVRQQAEVAIQQEVKSAKDKLQAEIAELSVAAAEDILRKNIEAQDQQRLVQEFMTRVVEAK